MAPEHISDPVLQKMGKPPVSVYNEFVRKYHDMNERLGLKQYLVPYLMSSHPGSTLQEAVDLAEYLRDLGYMPQQVQDFYPTPSTISTCMYYTGLDPRTMEPVYVATNPHEKAMQRALIQYRNPENYDLVHEALVKTNRTDLIGFEAHCLIRPRKLAKEEGFSDKKKTKRTPNQNQTKSAAGNSDKNAEKYKHNGKHKNAGNSRNSGISRSSGNSRISETSRNTEKFSGKTSGQNMKKKHTIRTVHKKK